MSGRKCIGVAEAAPYFCGEGGDSNSLESVLAVCETASLGQVFFAYVYHIFMEETKMNYVEFQEKITVALSEQLPEGTTVTTKTVLKNNDVERVGLLIAWKDSNLSPVLYLDYYYAMYEGGRDFDEVVNEMREVCMQNQMRHDIDTAFFTDWSMAREKITLRLVNFEENKRRLEQMPYRRFLDLAVIYQYVVEAKNDGVASIIINNFHMESWNVKEADLYECACRNYPRMMPVTVKSMNQLLGELFEQDIEDVPSDVLLDSAQMYIVTNKSLHNGAASMLFFKEIKENYEVFQQDLYILPSSVHEILVLPQMLGNVDELRQMVCEVNETLEKEDRLSNQVYRYRCGSGIIEIA